MLEWFMNLDISAQLFLSAAAGIMIGVIFTLFGEIVTPDDII